jgi:hypothetical protein
VIDFISIGSSTPPPLALMTRRRIRNHPERLKWKHDKTTFTCLDVWLGEDVPQFLGVCLRAQPEGGGGVGEQRGGVVVGRGAVQGRAGPRARGRRGTSGRGGRRQEVAQGVEGVATPGDGVRWGRRRGRIGWGWGGRGQRVVPGRWQEQGRHHAATWAPHGGHRSRRDAVVQLQKGRSTYTN